MIIIRPVSILLFISLYGLCLFATTLWCIKVFIIYVLNKSFTNSLCKVKLITAHNKPQTSCRFFRPRRLEGGQCATRLVTGTWFPQVTFYQRLSVAVIYQAVTNISQTNNFNIVISTHRKMGCNQFISTYPVQLDDPLLSNRNFA